MSKTCWDDHLNDFGSPDSVNFMIFTDNESAEPYSGADSSDFIKIITSVDAKSMKF